MSGLTDDWEDLRNALESVRDLARRELTDEDMDEVGQLIARIRRMLRPR